jgi:hypothetical protein
LSICIATHHGKTELLDWYIANGFEWEKSRIEWYTSILPSINEASKNSRSRCGIAIMEESFER